MHVRKASKEDIKGIMHLLVQVNMVHHNGRPDLFKGPTTKYSEQELETILEDGETPVFVCVDKIADLPSEIPVNINGETVLGHAFCIMQEHAGERMMQDMKTLYIDDICVEETARGRHVGQQLYRFAEDYARSQGCYNVTLNVWECNPGARAFYEAMGMGVQKTGMEKIL
ncbi:MAG: GNAT family N-acetyltransferase [Blautia sp.]|nr:GNAT family N-acetyltransferase [Blautia sp.]